MFRPHQAFIRPHQVRGGGADRFRTLVSKARDKAIIGVQELYLCWLSGERSLSFGLLVFLSMLKMKNVGTGKKQTK